MKNLDLEKATEDESPKKLSLAPIYHENPFIDNMVGELKIKRKTQLLKSANKNANVMLINDDGVLGHAAFMRKIEVDEDKFAKIYISQLGALWELKKTSLKVLTYILFALKPNDDKILLDWQDCMKYCQLKSPKSVFDGLLGLLNVNIIARTEKSYFYYINPAIVFNGSRVTFMTTYTKKKKEIINANQMSLLDQPGVVDNQEFLNQ